MMSEPAITLLNQLAAEGVSPWLAGSDTQFLPGTLYRPAETALLHGAVAASADPETVRRACDTLWETYLRTEGRYGRVSVPVDPRIAHDAEAIVADACSIQTEVGRPNVLVRIAATPAGLAAMESCLALGIGVDTDLVFSAGRYEEFLTSYLAGMERALAAGRPLGPVVAVASVPVGLLDAEVNDRLATRAGQSVHAARARDTAGIALARSIYRIREERLGGNWWRVLRAAGAVPPGLLWTAVTARHISGLVGSNTGQVATLDALEEAAAQADLRGDTLLNAHEDARRDIDLLETLGVRMAEVAGFLEAAELGRLRESWILRQ
ncbi:transaldolase family protein [Streptomyces sp. NPDC048603]|uniref:transaldolase family protein n=1 Tax=Streptomyces sp. NPDC048603 TaxID=3365577 RepID=UPI00371C56F9